MFEIIENISIYKLAKIAGFKNPQALYNLCRQGYGVKVQRTKNALGKDVLYVKPEDANEYLKKRASKLASK